MSKFVSRVLLPVPLGLMVMMGTGGCNTEAGRAGSAVSTCRSQQADSSVGVRLYLDDAVLGALQKRAAANDPAWVALKAHCDALTGATFNPPSGNAYPNPPNVGQGYQGDGYLPEVMSLGLCYRVIHGIDSKAEASYGAAGAQLLTVIATPASSGGQDPSTDDGYGIRNYGVAMATGYDWLGPALSSAQKQAIVTALDAWIDWYDAKGFSNAEPIGNYFAGYLLAKTTTAIATDPDNASAAGYWSDVQTRMWQKLAHPAYATSMQGGGWPEGWEYGPLAVREMAQFLWAVKTGKGLDWGAGLPFARDEASYVRSFAWPSLHHMDDQGTIHSQTRLAPSVPVARALAGILGYIGDPAAASARSYVADLVATGGDSGDPWEEFLFQDPSLATQPYTSDPLSYLASGPGHVAVRSAWQKDAVWGTFVAGTYIDAPDSGEQLFNQGSVAVVAGDQPILVNATGWLPQAGGNAGETFVYDDSWGNKTRLLYNTFFAAGVAQVPVAPGSAQTQVAKYEEQGAFAHARGVHIADMYATGGVGVSQFTRDFAYVRPGTFVVYDRTTLGGSADQWLAWHTPTQPTAVATSDATQARFDVASQGATVGSIRTLLPRTATAMKVNLVNGAAWRLEMHSPTQAAAQDWLTVVTAGASVPDETRLSSADGNVTAGAVVGVHVLSSPRNAVVLFGDDHAAAATVSAVTYAVTQTAPADHLIFDMAPSSTGYAVTATPVHGALAVTVSAGGPLNLTVQGTLAFTVGTDGTVRGMVPPPASPDAGSSQASPNAGSSPTSPDAGSSSAPDGAGSATMSGAPATSSGSSSSSGGGC
ncbi:MAG TPA: hypothetical protein VKU41_29990 [Polyangiaceae bacterium]|nr:hypothetical protein [Polyangiaceae bacterium]